VPCLDSCSNQKEGGRAETSVVVRISSSFNGRTGFAFYFESFPDLSFSFPSWSGLTILFRHCRFFWLVLLLASRSVCLIASCLASVSRKFVPLLVRPRLFLNLILPLEHCLLRIELPREWFQVPPPALALLAH
jgi:hypothetical protein